MRWKEDAAPALARNVLDLNVFAVVLDDILADAQASRAELAHLAELTTEAHERPRRIFSALACMPISGQGEFEVTHARATQAPGERVNGASDGAAHGDRGGLGSTPRPESRERTAAYSKKSVPVPFFAIAISTRPHSVTRRRTTGNHWSCARTACYKQWSVVSGRGQLKASALTDHRPPTTDHCCYAFWKDTRPDYVRARRRRLLRRRGG